MPRFETLFHFLLLKIFLKLPAEAGQTSFVQSDLVVDLADEVFEPLQFALIRIVRDTDLIRVVDLRRSRDLQADNNRKNLAHQDGVDDRHGLGERRFGNTPGSSANFILPHFSLLRLIKATQVHPVTKVLKCSQNLRRFICPRNRIELVSQLNKAWHLILNPLFFAADQVDPKLALHVVRGEEKADDGQAATEDAAQKSDPARGRSRGYCQRNEGDNRGPEDEGKTDQPNRTKSGKVVLFHRHNVASFCRFVERLAA
jgi:hypothetical protein